jgi:splicing factor U2AF 35 kDa subunit
MADHLARIFGTEEDKVNCPFFYKIGACRHGERCSRNHMRPAFSQTLLIPHLYAAPPQQGTPQLDDKGQPIQPDDSEHFEDFYEDVLDELVKFGEVEELHIVANLGDHMFGNIYVKYHTEEEAEIANAGLRGRYYWGRLVMPEYSPVTDFREARCRQYDEDHCARGGYCNFIHLRKVPKNLRRRLDKWARKARRRKRGERSRSRSRGRRDDKGRDSGSSGTEEKKISGEEDDAARRAKIALWNKMREKPSTSTSDASSTASTSPVAVTSASTPTATTQSGMYQP